MNRFFLAFCYLLNSVSFSQQTEYVDFKSGTSHILALDPAEKSVMGKVVYEFEILKDIDSVYLDAVNLKHSTVSLDDFEVRHIYDGRHIIVKSHFKAGETHKLFIDWVVQPKQALYFVGDQIWTQGQGKYTSNWLPSIDDVNDKIEFDLSISYNANYEVVANGNLVDVIEKDSIKTWHFNMDKPMSSYLVALAIGNYDKRTETSNSGVPLEFYYYPEDVSKVEPTYRYSKQLFDFMEDEIGVPYPWEIYKQVPVKDFLYSGMENTTLTIFSDALVADSIAFKDRNYVNVNAHELAHQWFGNLVTATNSTHHWVQEGFATYYALLAERAIFGEDYYYWRLYEYAQRLLEQENKGESTALLNPKASSLTFYQKGCWALHILQEQVGEEAFREAAKAYLYKNQFKNVETADFIVEIEKASGQDISEFSKIWLEAIDLPQDAMVKSLKKSDFIREYLEVDCKLHPSKCNDYLVSDISDKAKVKILLQDTYGVKQEDFNNSWEVRQAIAQNLEQIPLNLKENYESLLNDKSYVTVEAALYNLWVNFPEERSKYLEKTKGITGFSDYNVRMLWLALALNTIEYQSDKKQLVFEELKGYTDPKYGIEARMNAFNFLKLINGFDEESVGNLIDTSKHHNWRFQQFAKNLLEELRNRPNYLELIDKNTTKQ